MMPPLGDPTCHFCNNWATGRHYGYWLCDDHTTKRGLNMLALARTLARLGGRKDG